MKNFFDLHERVKNITAIIGANGSGKTSTLELIKDIYSKKEIFSNGKFILIFTEEESNQQMSHIYYHNSLIEKFEEIDEVKLVKHSYFTEILETGTYDTFEFSNVKTPCIFFSNIFDGAFEQEITSDSGKQLYNISTNFLVRNDEEYWKEDSKKEGIGQINSYNASSVLRQVRFISEFNHLNLNFGLPQDLYIRLRNFSGVKRDNNLPEFYRQTINDVLSSDQINKDLIFKFIHSMINNYFDELIDYKKLDRSIDRFWGDNPEIEDNDLEPLNKIIQILEKWKEELKRERRFKEHTIIFSDHEVHQVNAMIKLINLCKGKRLAIGLDRKGLRIEIKNELQFLETFITNFFSSFQFRAYASFEWSNTFSSGQKAMIDLYSRFYSIAWEVNRNKSQDILIVIDEGELYLHPQWQKAFINNIIKFFTDLFPDKIIQIVLTSNSPILLSDLPKDCVMFLEEMDGKIQITDGLKDKNQTFAANIHSLFSDSFFLKGDLIGDFAKERINWLINILNGDIEMIRDKEEVVRKMINIIGEPIIKNKLISMLEDQLKVKLINVDKEIADLKERIEKLENQKRS
ncbi:hypothetical protein BK702_03765 [Bacillus thuringiensis serovar cameroun]|nr:hypothetical protein BK702_03765 [Bacillus thuringiensis serovar cameroun]